MPEPTLEELLLNLAASGVKPVPSPGPAPTPPPDLPLHDLAAPTSPVSSRLHP